MTCLGLNLKDYSGTLTSPIITILTKFVLNGPLTLTPNLVEDSATTYSTNLIPSISSTSPLEIRPSVKDSIVNANAFQKVFRSRLDEGRALVNASEFSNLFVKQPFISDTRVNYTNLLGKNRTSFFSTPLYVPELSKGLTGLNSIYTQQNTQMFEFPFLEALQSDLIRYT